MNVLEKKQKYKTSSGSPALLALISFILGASALWFAWFRYARLVNQPDFPWYYWVQLAAITLMGMLCLWAAILFVRGRSSARSLFKLGLSMVPLLLFANLMVFLFRIIQNILQGNANFFFERVFAQPYRILFILAIVIALAMLGSLNEKREQ